MFFVRKAILRLKTQREPDFVYRLENSGLSPGQISLLKWTLRILKLEHKRGSLDRPDMLNLSYAVGINPTEDLLESKLRQMKLSRRTIFALEHFAHLWFNLTQDFVDEKVILQRAFYFFDRDGNGELSISELKHTMKELGGLLAEEEIERFVSIMDSNNDGVIEYGEFIKTLQSEAPTSTLYATGPSTLTSPNSGGARNQGQEPHVVSRPSSQVSTEQGRRKFHLPGTPTHATDEREADKDDSV